MLGFVEGRRRQVQFHATLLVEGSLGRRLGTGILDQLTSLVQDSNFYGYGFETVTHCNGILIPNTNVKKLYPKGILEKGHKASLQYFVNPPCSMKNNFVPPCVWLTVFRGLLKSSTNQKSQFR